MIWQNYAVYVMLKTSARKEPNQSMFECERTFENVCVTVNALTDAGTPFGPPKTCTQFAVYLTQTVRESITKVHLSK